MSSRFYSPIESFIEQDSTPLRKRILVLVYASIYEDQPADVTKSLMRAYDEQCSEDDQPERETLDHIEAHDFMQNLYVHRRANQGRDKDAAIEEFEWPSSLPTDYPIRKGILRCVAIRMAAADHWQFKKMQEAYLAEHPEISAAGV